MQCLGNVQLKIDFGDCPFTYCKKKITCISLRSFFFFCPSSLTVVCREVSGRDEGWGGGGGAATWECFYWMTPDLPSSHSKGSEGPAPVSAPALAQLGYQRPRATVLRKDKAYQGCWRRPVWDRHPSSPWKNRWHYLSTYFILEQLYRERTFIARNHIGP